jgi:hypothetical protein
MDYKSHPDAVNLHYLSPELEQHLAHYLHRAVPWGFYAAALATLKCRKVTLIGFASHHKHHFHAR